MFCPCQKLGELCDVTILYLKKNKEKDCESNGVKARFDLRIRVGDTARCSHVTCHNLFIIVVQRL